MVKNLHIELTNRCNIKCLMCPRTRFGVDELSDLPIKTFKNLDLDTFERILVIGCLGDSLYYPHLKEFFVYAKGANKSVELLFATNGIGKNESWWKKLPLYLPISHKVMFALDGTDNETLNMYRCGSNYEKVIRNMRTFVDAGGNAEWQFIVFKHNEHQLEHARKLAKEYGATFALRSSYYYDNYNKNGLRPESMQVTTQYEQSRRIVGSNIVCRLSDSSEVFVDSFGRILPCCLLGAKIDVANRITRGIIFNVKKHSLRRCLSDHYINGILSTANRSEYCRSRCKVPFETIILERTEPND